MKIFAKLLFLLIVAAGNAYAAPRAVEYFQVTSWAKFQSDLPKPHVVVFSTTDCGHCPDVIIQVSKTIKSYKEKVYLSVVVMDGLSHEDYLLSAPHYLMADRIFAFKGQVNAIKHSVNPSWRGLTPYVALLPQKGEVMYVLGKPSNKDISILNGF